MMWQGMNLQVREFKKDMKEEEERGWKSHKRMEILKGMRDNRET